MFGIPPSPGGSGGRRPRRPAVVGGIVSAVAALLLTACGGAGDPGGTRAGGPGGARPGAAAAGFPVTVDNCGVRTTYRRPPSRVVTIHQHPAELMLALGLESSMAGTAFPDSEVLAQYRQAYERIPELSAKEPSFETVLEAGPDLVYGGYGSAFAEKEGRSRKAFADAGIDTHLNLEYCAAGRLTMDHVHEEIRTVGKIFGVADRAERLVQDMQRRVDAVTGKLGGVRPVPVFVYDSGDKTAFTAGGTGIGQEIIRLAGGSNVFGDLDKVFGDVSWEQVVDRRPEVIVIYDYGDPGNVAEKKRFLQSQPALADVPAVKNRRFAVLPLTATVVGVRPPQAVEELAGQLHPERFR
ncbi:iron complex transport system substrate-binding protein [Streptosporangium becharense]|uniref:Iron complex transport system substrate-binding protein n=1 Tax=Streptosporangium becharense TaxID=1816182 RepID=A0A7W9IA60_9ACTN|nr:ABC transporter substrate-binding protein [Streptosporangium becharense]MBB2915355.1 iron complex transport system substrate-binding protein [Streptosporangium becharense]MBB5816947.1 iron complex transport system substrate-binding protein [Streptosporangium becharense]